MRKLEIRQTNDGSNTLYLPELNETYHSTHGAKQEAEHIFINEGLAFQALESNELTIFEMGFGTGLNALLTAEWTKNHACKVNYIGIELYPISEELWSQMDYVNGSSERELYSKIMSAEWGTYQEIHPRFRLIKWEQDVRQMELSEKVDLIYFDAFGPRAQSEMWDMPILSKMKDALKTGGVLVTYCAQGQMKRNLKALGLQITSLPGPPGKREMTRATKI